MQQKTEAAIERAKAKHPAVCYVFDCLYLDGRPIVNEPLTRRREWLGDVIKKDSAYRVSEVVEEGAALFEADFAVQRDVEADAIDGQAHAGGQNRIAFYGASHLYSASESM